MACFILALTLLIKFGKKSPKMKALATKIYDKIVFNAILRTFVQGYLNFALSSYLNVKAMDYATAFSSISALIAIGIALMLTCAPFAFSYFISKYINKLSAERLTKRCGTLYEGIKIEN